MQRAAVTHEFDDAGSLPWARRTAALVRDRWQGGAAPDLAQILDTHPGLKRHRTVVVELAYEEFCLRRNAGEALDPVEFSGRFRSFERSIDCYLAFHSFVDNDPELAALKQKVAWPEAGCQFLGFHLIRELGRGAAGRVFLASELALSERLVALKVTVEGCHEAKMLGRLQHSNIVPIHSFREEGDAGELTAFWMPYCGQATLAAVLDSLYAPRPAVQAGNARRPCRRLPDPPRPAGPRQSLPPSAPSTRARKCTIRPRRIRSCRLPAMSTA